MCSHSATSGSRLRLRVGVVGKATHSSLRDATWSRDGRLDVVEDDEEIEEIEEGMFKVIVGVEGYVSPTRCWDEIFVFVLVVLYRATLRSVWRLFWNHIVTDFVSL